MAKKKSARTSAPDFKKDEILIEPDYEPEAVAPTKEVLPEVEEPEVKCCDDEPAKCSKCGLPAKDFPQVYNGLRIDLKASNGRNKCPRCWEPTEPY